MPQVKAPVGGQMRYPLAQLLLSADVISVNCMPNYTYQRDHENNRFGLRFSNNASRVWFDGSQEVLFLASTSTLKAVSITGVEFELELRKLVGITNSDVKPTRRPLPPAKVVVTRNTATEPEFI